MQLWCEAGAGKDSSVLSWWSSTTLGNTSPRAVGKQRDSLSSPWRLQELQVKGCGVSVCIPGKSKGRCSTGQAENSSLLCSCWEKPCVRRLCREDRGRSQELTGKKKKKSHVLEYTLPGCFKVQTHRFILPVLNCLLAVFSECWWKEKLPAGAVSTLSG